MKKGFTLVELLVVIAIIGLIASIVLVNLQGTRQRGRVAAGKQFSSQLQNTLGDQAVGIWRFNEGSGTTAYDNAGYGKNGTLTNGPVWKTEDECGLGLGSCLEFDGVNDYVNVSSAIAQGAGDFTLAVWIKPDTLGSQTTLVSQAASTPFWILGVNSGSCQGNKPLFLINTGATITSCSTHTLSLGEWAHIVVVADRDGQATFYVNGTPKGSASISAQNGDLTRAAFTIGGASWVNYFDGMIDDVSIYASTLTTAQVQQLYAEEREKHLAEQ